jgi:hypothetical protein
VTTYVVPKQWSRGDVPTAAQMNQYSTALTAAHEVVGDTAVNPVIQQGVSEARFFLRHTHRYLFFRSQGQIEDPNGVEDPVSLSEQKSGAVTRFDLDDVGWLNYGMIYMVTGCSQCMEDSAP